MASLRYGLVRGCKRARSLLGVANSPFAIHRNAAATSADSILFSSSTTTINLSSSSDRYFSSSSSSEKPTVGKLGPEVATEKGLAVEQGKLPRRWIDEPVPASSLSAMQEFPGVPKPIPGTRLHAPRVQISTLSNGLRIATQDNYGQVSTFAMFVDAGSMYEQGLEQGSCHFLETTAFKSTTSRTAADVLEFQMRRGMGSAAVFNREVVMYKVDTLRVNIDPALELLADAVMNAGFTDEEMAAARQIISYQRDEALSQPQVLVSEHLYTASYGENSPLGRPEKCADKNVNNHTADSLRAYMAKYFTASRMVLSAVNVDHDVAVRAAEKFFCGVNSSSSSSTTTSTTSSSATTSTSATKGLRIQAAAGAHIGRVKSPYIGGDVRSTPDWASVPATAAAAQAASKTDFTHLMLALPTVGWSHDDVVPVCVVDTLLGGGSSFSAGGPGKGMYSRLYREVLNTNQWVESANAFSAQLYDCGIVGIYGAAPPDYAGDLTSILASHLIRLCEQPVDPSELKRSTNQLASSVLMNLETRGLLVEDIGRQILSHGKRLDPAELVQRIRAVTQEDIIRVMRTALSNPPSFAAVGDVSRIAQYEQIREYFEKQANKWKHTPGSVFGKIRK